MSQAVISVPCVGLDFREIALTVGFENVHFLGKHHYGPLGSETVVLLILLLRLLGKTAAIWVTARATRTVALMVGLGGQRKTSVPTERLADWVFASQSRRRRTQHGFQSAQLMSATFI